MSAVPAASSTPAAASATGTRTPSLVARAWPVARGAWVALAQPHARAAHDSSGGRWRRLADRRASRVAAVVALRLARLAPDTACVSRAHSAGAGAAAVAPAGWRVGVDVTPLARVTARHALTVASDAELALVCAVVGATDAAALLWALKEAAVKATGTRGLGAMPSWIIRDVGASHADLADTASNAFVTAGWLIDSGHACAWVLAPPAAA